ncbi:MAG: hypothetical protein R3252_12335, partial [Robiginitalea sp.]|nr:hypothetical protein [Robiginitalea sp.]
DIRVGEAGDDVALTDINENARITFHPEGGQLLAGVPNRLVVQASLPDAEGLKGHIVDEAGRQIVPVQQYGGDYGMAIFRPEPKRRYRLRTLQGEEMDLPEIASRGYSLKVNNLETEKLSLEIQPTEAMGGEPVVLKGERDGKTYFIHMLEFEGQSVATLEIPKAGLPVGFMNFSLTGLDETVWTRRPVWIDRPGALNIEVTPLSTEFSKGGEAGFRIRVTDLDGKPIQTDLSVAVTEGGVSEPRALPSYLSPLSPEKASREGRQNRFLQDLKTQALASGREERTLPGEIRYPVQRSLELHGTAYDLDNNLLANTEIQMLASSDSTLVIRETKTDAAGVLHLEDLEVIGETQFVFRTKGAEQEQRLVRIVPVKETPKKGANEEVTKSKMYQKAVKRKALVETTPVVPFDTTGVIRLKEATVAKRREQQKVVPTIYGLRPNPNDVVYQDPERPIEIDILLRKIPGVQSRVNALGVPVVWHVRRGGGGILWVVDGQVIYTDDPFLSPLTFLTPGDILRMEFYIDVAQTSMFGVITNPGTGVIVIYTRNGMFMDYTDRKKGGFLFKGFEPAPDYKAWLAERQQDRKLRKKDPKTLYWNPEIRTDKKGEAIIRFESPGEYNGVRLSVETLTKEGLVGSYQGAY